VSEHDSHEDAGLSALYRRTAQQEPSPQLDARVLAAARRLAQQRSRRWWLPLSTAAVVVLAVSLLWRMELRPYELPSQMAPQLSKAPRAEKPVAPVVAPEAEGELQAASRSESLKQARKAAVPEKRAKAAPPAKASEEAPAPLASMMAEDKAVPATPEAKSSTAPQEVPREALSAGAAAPAGVASSQESVLGEAKMEEEAAVEAPDAWLKRIEALRAKGDLEAARRELLAFRKHYPDYKLTKELQALLPDELK